MYKAIIMCLMFCPLFARDISVELRSALFIPSSERFRAIYGNFGRCQELQISNQNVWINFDWFSKNGKSIGLGDPTHIRIANVSLGWKFSRPLSKELITYFGLGESLGAIRLKNQSQCDNEDLTKAAFGIVAKSGIYFFFNRSLFMDAFVDYLFQPVRFETRVNVGGLKIGIGLGVRFA